MNKELSVSSSICSKWQKDLTGHRGREEVKDRSVLTSVYVFLGDGIYNLYYIYTIIIIYI